MVHPGAIRALLVEDNPGDATLAQDLLAESLGSTIETSCAEQLGSAVSRLKQDTFDVIILDLLLPDASGLDALTKIVSTAPSIPVVILTGLGGDGIVAEAFNKGAQEFLSKGVPCEELGQAVARAIYRKRAEVALMGRLHNEGRRLGTVRDERRFEELAEPPIYQIRRAFAQSAACKTVDDCLELADRMAALLATLPPAEAERYAAYLSDIQRTILDRLIVKK